MTTDAFALYTTPLVNFVAYISRQLSHLTWDWTALVQPPAAMLFLCDRRSTSTHWSSWSDGTEGVPSILRLFCVCSASVLLAFKEAVTWGRPQSTDWDQLEMQRTFHHFIWLSFQPKTWAPFKGQITLVCTWRSPASVPPYLPTCFFTTAGSQHGPKEKSNKNKNQAMCWLKWF